ncbi:MAG TPA: S8 family serine peptidase [Thermomicrobiaceae bacterium]|nr:S8 family serine peptidase [Thermomicrobiaceae bacterium]
MSKAPTWGRMITWLALALTLLGLATPGVAAAGGTGSTTSSASATTLATGWIVGLRGGASGDAEAAMAAAVGARMAPISSDAGAFVARFQALGAVDGVARLLANPDVQYVEPDVTYSWLWQPNDPYYPQETWERTARFPDAWSLGTGRASTIVAVLDSGIHAANPDLSGKLLNGYDFLSNDTNTSDSVGHGTAIAGIIAARGNDGVGIAGGAMDVQILPVKVGNADGAPVSAISQGIYYAVDHGAAVINLSLGSDSPSATLQDAINYAYSKNVVVVAAAGNSPDQVSFPASFPQTISVAATTSDGTNVASFSSRLSRVDLAAPGEGVFSTFYSSTGGDTYQSLDGTSFSTAIVSAAVALMRAANPGLPVEAVRADLTGTARQDFPSGTLGGGAGLLDAGAALRRAMVPSMTGTWQTPDQPVAVLAASRSWEWGPHAFSVVAEPYVETQHGSRLVAYFDKARMEITSPYGDASSPWYVTNGLLASEMIRGRIQLGNTDGEFQAKGPAQIPVAGDQDDQTGPLYASFTGLMGAAPLANGSTVTHTINRAGTVSSDQRLASYGVTAGNYVQQTNHSIASVFAAYLQSAGEVLQNGSYQNGPLFNPAFYATGFPITEPYWARVKVKGTVQDVLVQCFERRCLTYTPSNPAGWQVEMGNVGRHYYLWRYGTQPPSTPSPDDPSAFAVGPH